jgi:hypothetical protein
MSVDLYSRDNVFYLKGANKRIEQPAMRDYLGHTLLTMRDNIAYEAALGDHGRFGEQFDIWQAVYSPLGPKVRGKLHVYVGSDDTYFLNDAVYLLEEFLKQTGTPGHGVPYEGEVAMGHGRSTAGMATPTSRTGTPACTTIRCTCPRSWTASGRPPPQARI